MVLNIPENGVSIESSAQAAVELPRQAFAIALSPSVIEDMILCVQNGGDIQLALGSSPKFRFDDHELRIPKTSDPSGYDLFWANSENPSSAIKLPNPTMSIFKIPKSHPMAKAMKGSSQVAKREPASRKAPAKASKLASGPAAPSPKDPDPQGTPDPATARLERSLASLAADKRENSYASRQRIVKALDTNLGCRTTVVTGLPSSRKGKVKAPSKRLLEPQAAALPRSLPPSPALSAIGSPSLLPSGGTAQERVKQLRFPIIHELAVRNLSRQELLSKWHDGTEEEFDTILGKVADLDADSQKWSLKKMFWKELDVFEYNYSYEEDRQKAINNAIKQYDRSRIGTSDPLWQKLLPKSDRGKGICLSRLQAAIAKGPAVSAPKQKADASNPSGGDSDSASSVSKKGKGGEPMSRSSSQTSTGKKKLSPSEAQAKRLLSKSKKPGTAATTKPAPKASPAKTSAKGASAKGRQPLSKEYVSDSSSTDDEVPLSTSMAKSKTTVATASKPTSQVAEKPKAAQKPKESKESKEPKESPTLKPKVAATSKTLVQEDRKDRERDTIRAQVTAKPAKRPRDAEDDDSSSSGTPLSKRVKSGLKTLPAPIASAKTRTTSDTSQNSRGTLSAVAAPKGKNTSPAKSSPLASSPPTNASDMEQDRAALARARERERQRERERERGERDTSVSAGTAKKRPSADSLPGNKAKRPRPSQETLEMAARFKRFYREYEKLHRDITNNDNPDPNKLTDLIGMHEQLSRMKSEIYAAVEAC
ncbi:hypothetical protein C8A03DRAFT_15215 [Achaetomium macrosporum]|uniref:RNA polymerase II elongation factor ELL N-terminal domain-containing protein n=1 Tax=Achaetomium macrosporum TaxID=79813 RepID=A0AAN7CBK7_9PEZI|nr:hypothetical protein C8A03DRAFT_15215 [Achaetomium macrosporum]